MTHKASPDEITACLYGPKGASPAPLAPGKSLLA
eukprot:CAMPEP_0174923076 /NCGR_PEP_ID=MMETSP1355-20121228/6340_1 /TAXON_ID=464990 /ORGANISM="Hemiselmis tepida, Strain CCMP443" /LENGTH=33 /DNA_ID= /DNA_START= /DNA_END= /DNA_ORIENTATION=